MGSLEILGNPTGLVRSIGNGVADMFSMPYQGLTRGPGEFLNGVRCGTGSLLWHLSTGFYHETAASLIVVLVVVVVVL